MKGQRPDGFYIGWGKADITPDQPVALAGQFHARVSEGVLDPITATALVFEKVEDGAATDLAIMVSCDLVAASDSLRDGVREKVKTLLPRFDTSKLFLFATHTHTAPEARLASDSTMSQAGFITDRFGVDLEVMGIEHYAVFAIDRISAAIVQAWEGRTIGGVSFGLGHAVVGHNRRVSYADGSSVMYGKTDDPNFSHIEGYEDHSVNIVGTYDSSRKLTGLIVNVACPSQLSEQDFRVSADYWCEVREEISKRCGEDVHVLPQCSAAGDQSPHVQLCRQAEERMLALAQRSRRREVAVRIADAVAKVLPVIENAIVMNPVFSHCVETVEIPRRLITDAEAEAARSEAEVYRKQYEEQLAELNAYPVIRSKPRWYQKITHTFRRMHWFNRVAERMALAKSQPEMSIEVHVVRLDEVAFATNPFEYYLDFGCHIKARSKAVQTFLIQLAGSAGYAPTVRATTGGSYGAIPASTAIGPEGGLMFAKRTVEVINSLWQT